ncbi:AraC family transcriptional regulator [Amycolatopsis alkalitolerans]|uniref:AraC family transcriptional regulator n=1 Tax=Amycolatopsis alkalitolerans TaxID=2547244 RepID=A0A5C4M7L2_9PSEU|nr:AraC family transcriptional regulator [Amycolatopsis alkalitolerans]TNC28506.1 AraC family transcriptional regulator [Amycolatopsis alkalitolerans]
MTPLPLERCKLFESRNLDETRDHVAKIFCPHKLDLLGPNAELHARMHCHRIRNIAIAYVAYGWDTRVDPGELGSFFAVMLPAAGTGTYQSSFEHVQTGAEMIAVASPTEPVQMRLSKDCGNIVVRIERAAVEARLSEMLNGPLRRPIRFQLGMDVTTGYARSWVQSLKASIADLGNPDSLLTHPLAMEQFEQALIVGLLLAQPHNYTRMLNGDHRPVPSRLLGVTVDLLEGHPEWAHTSASLARQAGVSVRALQKAFREQLDSSPSEYLRGVRLQRVHDELCAAQCDTTTVGEITSRWGIVHHGRFAAVYRARFGESPKQTLGRQHARRG